MKSVVTKSTFSFGNMKSGEIRSRPEITSYMSMIKNNARRNIFRHKAIDTIIHEDKWFEINTLMDMEPMKLSQVRGDVLIPTGTIDQPGSFILYSLQLIKLSSCNAKKEWIAVIKTRCNKGPNNMMTWVLILVFPNTGNIPKLEIKGATKSSYLAGHRAIRIYHDAKVSYWFCWFDNCSTNMECSTNLEASINYVWNQKLKILFSACSSWAC